MLEKMSDFFEARLDGYDEHMMTNIESANEFYPFTAKQLPTTENCHVLDLGCGTGLELQEYYLLNPSAMVTGIDLSQGMLAELKRKFANKDITLMLGSYFDVPFGEEVFDAAVSVESLHHFTKGEKIKLYSKLHKALKDKGYFILTDYFSLSDDEEQMHRRNLLALKAEQGITDDEFYHYDTPLTVKHESEALDGVKIQPNGAVVVTLPAPKFTAEYDRIIVVFIADDGSYDECKTTVNDDGTISFETDYFSKYAVIGVNEEEADDRIGVGAIISIVVGAVLVVGGGAFAIYWFVIKKKNKPADDNATDAKGPTNDGAEDEQQ